MAADMSVWKLPWKRVSGAKAIDSLPPTAYAVRHDSIRNLSIGSLAAGYMGLDNRVVLRGHRAARP